MLNILWTVMILTGIAWAAFHGTLGQVTDEMLAASGEAVSLCITMLGVMVLWTGVLEAGKRAGLIERLSGAMRPILRFLFPELPPESEAARQISVNMIANFLGLGWAATPAGFIAAPGPFSAPLTPRGAAVTSAAVPTARKNAFTLCLILFIRNSFFASLHHNSSLI